MLTLPVDPSPANLPSQLGAYLLAEPLGRGGNGVVLRGHDASGQTVAVKTIPRLTERGFAELRAELHALNRVQHRGIVRVIADGTTERWPWFAMELLEGVTLADHMRRHSAPTRWSPAELDPVLDLVARLCDPLAALHEHGIVHRDLKPENIFILADGHPVILDLGIACQQRHEDSRAPALPSARSGTRAYMAPEQLTRELVDARTDLYALGCILFELLAGVPPSPARSTRPSAHVDGIPQALDVLVESLLRPSPRDRIGHAHDVQTWIATMRSGVAAISSRPMSRWLYRPRLSGRRDVLVRAAEAITRLGTGRGSLFAIEGDSGVGKTHTASAIARLADDRATVIPVMCETGAGPLACWSALFERVVDRAHAEPSSRVASLVAECLPVLRTLHPVFRQLPGDATYRPSPDEVCLTIRDFIAAFARERPVMLLIDDLQWADELTLGTLQLLAGDWLARHPVFLVVTCRTHELTPDASHLLEHGARVVLGPLPMHDIRELVADMLGVGQPPESIVSWVAQRAEGNPFLAAEYLRLLVAETPLDRDCTLPAVRLLPPPEDVLEKLPRPASEHDLVMRRLVVLDGKARATAELVAVLGGSIDARTLATLELDHRDSLFELQHHQVLEATAEGGRRLLHDRVRVVLDREIVAQRRQALHRLAGEVLVHAGGAEHYAAAIARHLRAAELPQRALRYFELAGEQSLGAAAYAQAAALFDEARRIVEDPAIGASLTRLRRVRLEHCAARARYGGGDMSTFEARVRDSLAHAGTRLPRDRLGWFVLAAREGLTGLTTKRSGESELMLEAGLAAAMLPFHFFFEEEMLAVVGSSLLAANLAKASGRADVATAPMSLLAAMAGLFRMTRVARRYFDTAQSAAVSARDHREASQAYALESHYQGSFARWHEARTSAARALEICDLSTDPWLRENAESTYSHVDYFTGDLASAGARAERIERSARERNNVQHHVWGLFLRARSDIPAQRWATAERDLEAACELLATRSEMMSEVPCYGMLARVRLHAGDEAAAETLARRVNDLVRGRLPVAYPTLVGYDAAARVLRTLVARDRSPSRWRAANEIGVSLWRFAGVFPVALPAAITHSAHLVALAGWSRTAARMLAYGSARARRMGLFTE